MTPFGVVALMLALIHDYWAPAENAAVLWPYGLIATGFYFCLDMAVGGVLEVFDKTRG